MTKLEIQKQINQLESSINDIEDFLGLEEFKDYSDAVHTCVAYWNKVKKQLKDE